MILSAGLQTCAPQRPCVDLRAELRAATRSLHDEVDALYAGFDRRDAAGLAEFLQAQLAGWSALDGHWQQFLPAKLGCPAPDYVGMIRSDLAEIGEPPLAIAEQIPVPAIAEPAGVIYVLAGSRLGIAAMRKETDWTDISGRAGRFMRDRQGAAVFKAWLRYLESPDAAQLDPDRVSEAAETAFELFIAAARLQQRAGR